MVPWLRALTRAGAIFNGALDGVYRSLKNHRDGKRSYCPPGCRRGWPRGDLLLVVGGLDAEAGRDAGQFGWVGDALEVVPGGVWTLQPSDLVGGQVDVE